MLPTIQEDRASEDYSVVIEVAVLEEKPVDPIDKAQTVVTTVATMIIALAIFSFAVLAFNHDWDTIVASGLVLAIVLGTFYGTRH